MRVGAVATGLLQPLVALLLEEVGLQVEVRLDGLLEALRRVPQLSDHLPLSEPCSRSAIHPAELQTTSIGMYISCARGRIHKKLKKNIYIYMERDKEEAYGVLDGGDADGFVVLTALLVALRRVHLPLVAGLVEEGLRDLRRRQRRALPRDGETLQGHTENTAQQESVIYVCDCVCV